MPPDDKLRLLFELAAALAGLDDETLMSIARDLYLPAENRFTGLIRCVFGLTDGQREALLLALRRRRTLRLVPQVTSPSASFELVSPPPPRRPRRHRQPA